MEVSWSVPVPAVGSVQAEASSAVVATSGGGTGGDAIGGDAEAAAKALLSGGDTVFFGDEAASTFEGGPRGHGQHGGRFKFRAAASTSA